MIKQMFLKAGALLLACAIISGATLCSGTDPLPFEVDASAVDIGYGMTASYKSGKYYKNLKNLDLSGDEARDVLAIAMSQVGYHEGNSESELDGLSSAGTRDFVEYNVLFGKLDNNQGNGVSYGYYWCASFVNWCLRLAGVDEDASGSDVSCKRWYSASKKMGIFKSKGGYIPGSGDIIFFRDSGSSDDSTHVGLVRYSDGKYVYTVEGNTSNGSEYSSHGEYVALKKYELSSGYIVGYASPTYEANKTARRVDYSGGFLSLGDYISSEEIRIYTDSALSTDSGKQIPVHTVFKVIEISGEYLKVKADAAEGYVKANSPIAQLTTTESIYTVNYVSETGATMFMPQYRRADEQKYVYSNKPQRDKSGFVGWKLQKSQSEILSPGDKLPNTDANITLVAVFDTNYYVVSFKNEDGTLIDQFHGYYGTTFTYPEAPSTPEGYVFTGWSAGTGGVIKGDASYTATFMTEEEFIAAGGGTENRTEAETSGGLDEGVAQIVSTVAAGAVMLVIPIALIPLMFVKKKRKRR